MEKYSIIEFDKPIILATASPARKELIANTGLKFTTTKVEIDERPKNDEDVKDFVERLAREKSEAVKTDNQNAVIITVDTAIGILGDIIGKPKDEAHARKILSKLSNRSHEVLTCIATRNANSDEIETRTTSTEVMFTKLTEQMIDWYISTMEWENRAGAYAIQGKGASLIKEVNGCFTNVIGISIPSLIKMLNNL